MKTIKPAIITLGTLSILLIAISAAQAATTTPSPQLDMSKSAGAEGIFVTISDRLMPSVVNIFTTQAVRGQQAGRGLTYPWGNLFDEPNGQSAQAPKALGTGFIIAAEHGGGLILTNHHVIAGADEIKVKFTEAEDEAELSAEVVSKDAELDVALLRVKTDRKLQPAVLGDSDRLKVGEWVAAMGNPFGHGHSISHGIVSARERSLPGSYGHYLQTDAPINPGNSGGPLVNMAGEVIGINNAIDARGPGIGFAIPINSVKEVLARLKSGSKIDRSYLGILVVPLQADLAQALGTVAPPGTPMIAQVPRGTPAARAGLQPYDIIAQLQGKAIHSPEQLIRAIRDLPVGQKVSTQVIRRGKTLDLKITLDKRPDSVS